MYCTIGNVGNPIQVKCEKVINIKTCWLYVDVSKLGTEDGKG